MQLSTVTTNSDLKSAPDNGQHHNVRDYSPAEPAPTPTPMLKRPCSPAIASPASIGDSDADIPRQHVLDKCVSAPSALAQSSAAPLLPPLLPPSAIQHDGRRPHTANASPVRTGEDTNEAVLPPAPLTLPRKTSSFSTNRTHRRGVFSIDSVPRQTIMKALVSRPPPTSNLSITSTIQSLLAGNGSKNSSEEDTQAVANMSRRSRRMSEAFSDLHLDTSPNTTKNLAALHSPCFFHRRFDDAVNIEKVLAELQDDEWLSHSRLVQTATGVREVSRQLQRRPIKRAVKNIMIVTKARDNNLVHLTRELTEWLLTTPRYGSDVGVNVYVDAKLRRSRRFSADELTSKDERFQTMLRYWTPDLCWTSPEKFDLVLTLGGDGTVLYTSWLFQRIVPPILSFSLGSLGFLTNFEFASYKESLNEVMGDAGMRVNLRMRFTCTVYRAAPPVTLGTSDNIDGAIEAEQFEVLNELVIDRGPSPYVSNLELYGDNALLTVVQADGCIFSTPTGSTAYSLSAGGSLVHPDIPAILLTPICPHTLSFRPMLLNDTLALRIAVPKNSRATAYCAFDGKGRVELRQGDYVTIAASQYPFPTVTSRPTEWFDSISRTLRWNTRGATQKGWSAGGEDGLAGDYGVSMRMGEGYKHAPRGDEIMSPVGVKEQKFDIDFDDDERDSGYSAEGSSAGAGAGSPKSRRGLAAGW
jgi:NAD+ kinase